ncbi:uncharacterized protein LOC115700261 [Cannabis sativa]|uniref:Late embryogenesis abundant protein LEA-2 subgroup domain-containing protein n=1 Tax=Cannabis sativa TaxID=3483 RepID=A0A7J6HH79_CANSA|nr:uncharacterized protein LOC115700261 [Cannabis sativa]KAF4394425.1 hypothetical protein G4B88_018575 [Cannabis sativa]
MKSKPTGTSRRSGSRCLIICCMAAVASILITGAVFTALCLTVFKPREAEISTHFEDINNSFSPNITSLNVSIDVIITIDNRKNYGSFKFNNAIAYVYYHGDVVAEAQIQHNLVPARGKVNMTSSADFMMGKLISNPNFVDDVVSGSLHLTSTSSLHGKVILFKILRMHATTFSSCNISFNINDRDIQTTCNSKIKL